MKKILVMVVAVMVLLVGCSSSGMAFTLQNDTTYDFLEVYISPSSASSWGENLVEETTASGDTVEVDVPEVGEEDEAYDIRIVDHEMDAYLYYGVMIEDGGSISIYFGDNGLALDVMDDDGNVVSTVEGDLG